MIDIVKYNSDYKEDWDNLISNSRNGTFLLYRDYMDYHSDRFIDWSFLFYKKEKLEAVLPGNLNGKALFSHQGLTYGGLVSSVRINTVDVIEIFNLLNYELQKAGIHYVVYKPIPLSYHRIPAQEDIYALFKNNAKKIGCQISSSIFQSSKISFNELRKRGVKKSIKEGVQVSESTDFAIFWSILEFNLLNKYKTKPVHSLKEIMYLHKRFPDNIKLYIADRDGIVVAGTVLYIMENLVHVQYISASEIGKNISALDLIFDQLINKTYQHIPVFDFGQSTEKMGNYLNENLIFQKESFGGRGIVYETYRYDVLGEIKKLIHPTAEVQSMNIGKGTSVWQNCVVLENAQIGENCNINFNVFIENDVIIGDNVTIKSGVQIWDGLRIGNNVFIGPNVTFINDLTPRSKHHPEVFLNTVIEDGASIGANSTVLGGLRIGKFAMIGAGSLITKNVPDYTLWYGNPAIFRSYICECGKKLDSSLKCNNCGNVYKLMNGNIIEHDKIS